MKYTKENYIELSKRFNNQPFLGKLILIRNHSDIFTLETDGFNYRLRLEEEAQQLELDLLFQFPQTLEYKHMKDIFSLSDINNIKELR